MRPIIPAEEQWDSEAEKNRCKSVCGSARGSIFHRDLVCLVVAAGIAGAWIEGSEPAPRDVPMRQVQGARQDLIVSLAVSPDGKTMASCDTRGAVMIRDMLDWHSVRTYVYSEKGNWVWSMSFSPDGRYLAIGGNEPGIVVVDLRAGDKRLRICPQITRFRAVAFSPAGCLLAGTSLDAGKTVLCDPLQGKTLRVLSSPSVSLSVAFSGDGRMLATGGKDGNINVWDVSSGERRQCLEGALGPVFSVAFSPDGTLLASTGTGGPRVKLWEPSTGRLVQIIEGNSQSTNTVAFSPDGKALASGGSDGMLRIWDVATGRERVYLDGRSCMLRNVLFSPDGRMLLATANDNQIRLWEMARLKDDFSAATETGRKLDLSPSNNAPRIANSYSGSAPGPVYPVCDRRSRSLLRAVCLGG